MSKLQLQSGNVIIKNQGREDYHGLVAEGKNGNLVVTYPTQGNGGTYDSFPKDEVPSFAHQVMRVYAGLQESSTAWIGNGYLRTEIVYEKPPQIEVDRIAGYTALVSVNGIKLGCQTIPLENFDNLIEALDSMGR